MNAERKLPETGYEPRDASPRVVAITAAALAAMIVFALAVSGWVCAAHRPQTANGREMRFQHGPEERNRLEEDWDQVDRETRAHLQDYGWVDRSNGVVRVPIGRAMELMVQEPSR